MADPPSHRPVWAPHRGAAQAAPQSSLWDGGKQGCSQSPHRRTSCCAGTAENRIKWTKYLISFKSAPNYEFDTAVQSADWPYEGMLSGLSIQLAVHFGSLRRPLLACNGISYSLCTQWWWCYCPGPAIWKWLYVSYCGYSHSTFPMSHFLKQIIKHCPNPRHMTQW